MSIILQKLQEKENLNKQRSKLFKIPVNLFISYMLKNLYFNKYYKKKLIAKRNDRCSATFKKGEVYVPQGRVLVRVVFNVYKTGYKLGMFAATKKPFNFRPKKQKQKR